MGVLRLKPSARFDRLEPGGFRILGALDRVVRTLPYDLMVTCGSDSHGPMDPHTLGKACDVRTHGLTGDQKRFVLRAVMLDLRLDDADDPEVLPLAGIPDNFATRSFFGQLEHPGDATEHLHFQVRKSVTFP